MIKTPSCTQRYLPTMDLVFRKLFTTPANKRIIQGLLKDFYNLTVTRDQIRIINPYSIDNYAKDNDFLFDDDGNITYTAADGDFTQRSLQLAETRRDVTFAIIDTADVTIEMQLHNHKAFLQRSLYYLTTQYTSNYAAQSGTGAGTDDDSASGGKNSASAGKYESLKPVWALNILGFRMFPDDDQAFHNFSLLNIDTGEPLPGGGLLQLSFFELAKVPDNPNLKAWWEFFNTGIASPEAPDYIQEAAKLVDYQNFSPLERSMINLKEKAQAIAEAREAYVREEGITIGKEIGRLQGEEAGEALGYAMSEAKIAKKALAKGYTPEQIAELTDLTPEQIRALQ